MARDLHAVEFAALDTLRRVEFAEPTGPKVTHVSRAILQLCEEAYVVLCEMNR